MVPQPSAVTLCSIPPRQDNLKYQENVDLANGCLMSLAAKNNVRFLNNDRSFKLADGTVNDGYLLRDGLHLSYQGSRRLALNMDLKIKVNAKGDVTRRHKRRQNRQEKPVEEDDEWQVRSKRRKSNDRHRGPCRNCGEQNHASNNCRYGQPIACHTCGRLGHKASLCPSHN